MKAFQQRIIQEKAELDEKLAKLEAFFSTGTYEKLASRDQDLLTNQRGHMHRYSTTLAARIARFTQLSEAPDGQTQP